MPVLQSVRNQLSANRSSFINPFEIDAETQFQLNESKISNSNSFIKNVELSMSLAEESANSSLYQS